jgi:hypothetical protein
MVQNTPISLNITQSLDDLLVLLFWKIIKDNNFLLLDQNYTDREYSEAEHEEIKQVWYRLYDEYYKQCEDTRSKHELKKDADELVLSYRISRLYESICLMIELEGMKNMLPVEAYNEMYLINMEVFIKIEPKLKSKLNIFESADETLDKVNRYMSALSNQLQRLTKDKPERADKAVENIYSKIAYVATEIGLQLNVKDMTCNEWLAYQKIAYQKRAAQKQQPIKSKKR